MTNRFSYLEGPRSRGLRMWVGLRTHRMREARTVKRQIMLIKICALLNRESPISARNNLVSRWLIYTKRTQTSPRLNITICRSH